MDDVLITIDASYAGFDISRNGRFVRVETDYGLVVENDGEWTTLVQIPEKFRGKVYGLCGDADGNTENDLKTKEGTDMTGQDNPYTAVGDSYRVDPDSPYVLSWPHAEGSLSHRKLYLLFLYYFNSIFNYYIIFIEYLVDY